MPHALKPSWEYFKQKNGYEYDFMHFKKKSAHYKDKWSLPLVPPKDSSTPD